MSVEEGGECFKQTEDGVLLSENLLKRLQFKGASVSVEGSPLDYCNSSTPPPSKPIKEEPKQNDKKQLTVTQPQENGAKDEKSNAGTSTLSSLLGGTPKPVSNIYNNNTKFVEYPPMHSQKLNEQVVTETDSASKVSVTPVCGHEQEALVQCYMDNPGQILNCAHLNRELNNCLNEAKSSISRMTKESSLNYKFATNM